MSAVLKHNGFYNTCSAPPTVVVGTGPVGIRFVEELLQRDPHRPIVIYGNEPWEPYNRIRLASLLAGNINLSAIQNPLKLDMRHNVVQLHNCEIIAVDRENKRILDRHGHYQHMKNWY